MRRLRSEGMNPRYWQSITTSKSPTRVLGVNFELEHTRSILFYVCTAWFVEFLVAQRNSSLLSPVHQPSYRFERGHFVTRQIQPRSREHQRSMETTFGQY